MIVQELLTKLGFTVDPAGMERGKSMLEDFKSFALKIGIGAGIALLGKTAFDAATEMEDLGVQFKTLLGSQAEGAAMMEKVQKFAAATPYELPELANATKKLLAFGIANDQIMPTLQRVGDVAAGLKIPINDLADIYGKARVQGTLMSEDINQLTGRGVPVMKEFAKQLGVPESKVKELASKGKISFKNLEEAFKSLTSKGGKFAGMMDELSKTTTGKLSTAMDNLKQTAGNAFKQFLPIIKGALDFVGQMNLQPVVDFFLAAGIAVQYLGTAIWNSGLKEGVIAFQDAVLQLGGAITDSTGGAQGMSGALAVVGRVLGWIATAIVLAATELVSFITWVVELLRGAYEWRALFISIGLVVAALFGPAMVGQIMAFASATRIAAIANAFLAQAALAGGAATGYQVTMMGALKAALFFVQQGYQKALLAARAFAAGGLGPMAGLFAAIAFTAYQLYRLYNAIQELKEAKDQVNQYERASEALKGLDGDAKEWRKAKERGDVATMDAMSARMAAKRDNYKRIMAEGDKKAAEGEAFPSFDAMLKESNSKMDLSLQKTTQQGKRDVKVENNMEFNVNAPAASDGKTGLTADQVAELAAQAARATFNLQLQRVTVGLV